jgi:multidrug efflux pump
MEVQPQLQGMLSGVAGFQMAVFPRPSLPGGGRGFPIELVITSERPYDELATYADQIIGQAMGSGKFMFLRKSVEIDRPTVELLVDRDRAADLGIKMSDVARNLGTLLGGGYVNRFSMDGRAYKVIPQVERHFRLDEEMINDYYIRAGNGDMVPLSNLVRFKHQVEPSSRTQFQQLNALTIEGVMAPGTAQGEALMALTDLAKQALPKGFGVDYKGSSRQFVQQGSALMVTFFLSLLIIYLVLAAQYESWRDPAIILVSVPLSIAGAMSFITLGFASINIYTQVGLITLIGVVAKNGILIVEFANKLQINEGLNKREAVEKAARIRLRPILMTTVALIVAMVPLLTAAGPGAVSRFHIGLTIASGLGIGTLFTLFVLPAFYLALARDHNRSGV